MSNSNNDNTQISSNNSSNPGPSSAVESSTNDRATKLETVNTNKASSKHVISKIITLERTSENQSNTLVNQINTVDVSEETNPSINQNAGANSSNSNPGTSGATSSEIIDDDDLNNKITVTTQPSNDNHSNNSLENQTNIINEDNRTTVIVSVHQNVENDAIVSENHIWNNQTELSRRRSQIEYQNTVASFPQRSCQSQSSVTRNFAASNGNSPNLTRQHNVTATTKAQRCYRALSGQIDSDIEVNITPPPVPPHVIQGPPPIAGAPPTYSAIMRLGPEEQSFSRQSRHPIRIQPSPPFIAPIPPPPYSEVQGFHIERPMLVASTDQMVWGPDPLSVVCPRCANVVVTSTQSQRSNLTHFSALALCLCGCWPCCLLPYCMDSCKNTYHHCPNCQQFLGMYRPW